ncbi:MAG: ISAs1 family transposase, partial [Methylococcaceae bacterium]|nr:ISAs1 family transposase [Methylococcaceae bacterium]
MNRLLPDPRPYFADLDDPRRETKNKLHKLGDIVMLVFCCVLSGIEDWVGMEDFALEKEAWFREFLELPNGIPSHDTLGDVMGRLKPDAFTEAFLNGVRAALPSLSDEQICVQAAARQSRGRRRGSSGQRLRRQSPAGVGAKNGGGQGERDRGHPGGAVDAGIEGGGRDDGRVGDKTRTECRYYLCSFADLGRFAEAARGHWGIENG